MGLKSFCTDHKDTISGVTSALGISVAVIGFALTIWQINRTTAQLQATNEYNIRKDLRELVQRVRSDYIKPNCIDSSGRCEAGDEKATMFGLGLVFNLHHSIFLQSEAHGVSSRFKTQMADDFCSWMTLDISKKLWELQTKNGNYGPDRQRMKGEWCK